VPRGVPTLIVIILLAAGLSVFAWYVSRDNPQPQAAAILTSRSVPEGGWGPMRVMTANVRLDEPKDGANGWLNRRELLIKTLLMHMPDILGCQELSPAQGAYVRRELAPWYGYYPRAGVGSGSAPASGTQTEAPPNGGTTNGAAAELLGALTDSMASLNTVFYRADRFDILDGETGLVLPNELQANAADNTFFTLAVLHERRDARRKETNTGTLIVVDVHFRHNEAFAVRCAARVREKIAGWLAKYPNSGVVVLGDMNWDRTSKLHAALTGRDTLALVDTFDYRKMGTGKNGTYHAFTGAVSAAWPTDLIFVGGGLKAAAGAEVLKDKSADGRYPTDHFLVEAGAGW
jgi:hypothetical protein